VGEAELEVGGLRQRLSERLPTTWSCSDRAAGSDASDAERQARPQGNARPEYQSGQPYRAPRTPQEEVLCGFSLPRCWELAELDLDDNFFELCGGQYPVDPVGESRTESGLSLSPRDVFQRRRWRAGKCSWSVAGGVADPQTLVLRSCNRHRSCVGWRERGGPSDRFSQSLLCRSERRSRKRSWSLRCRRW